MKKKKIKKVLQALIDLNLTDYRNYGGEEKHEFIKSMKAYLSNKKGFSIGENVEVICTMSEHEGVISNIVGYHGKGYYSIEIEGSEICFWWYQIKKIKNKIEKELVKESEYFKTGDDVTSIIGMHIDKKGRVVKTDYSGRFEVLVDFNGLMYWVRPDSIKKNNIKD
jgi:transcription antitermination factor NusG